MDRPPTRNTVMESQSPGRCLICLSILLVVTGFVGVGGAQQTPTATTANTTTTAGGATDETTETASPSAGSTISAQPQTTSDTNDGWQNATPIDPRSSRQRDATLTAHRGLGAGKIRMRLLP